MVGSVNRVTIIGNLGRDPEARSMSNGSEVVSFSVATSDTWTDKQSGERRENTQWHNVVIFNENIGKIAKQYLRKGSTCYLEGALQTRKYADRDGVERSVTEVVLQRFQGSLVLLGGKGDGQASQTNTRETYVDSRGHSGGFADDLDDDVPF